jgi:hypothetical protein
VRLLIDFCDADNKLSLVKLTNVKWAKKHTLLKYNYDYQHFCSSGFLYKTLMHKSTTRCNLGDLILGGFQYFFMQPGSVSFLMLLCFYCVRKAKRLGKTHFRRKHAKSIRSYLFLMIGWEKWMSVQWQGIYTSNLKPNHDQGLRRITFVQSRDRRACG